MEGEAKSAEGSFTIAKSLNELGCLNLQRGPYIYHRYGAWRSSYLCRYGHKDFYIDLGMGIPKLRGPHIHVTPSRSR